MYIRVSAFVACHTVRCYIYHVTHASKSRMVSQVRNPKILCICALCFILLLNFIVRLICYLINQDKRLRVSLNGNRKVVGTLRGYDPFLNVVLEETIDEGNNNNPIGQVVLRGNSIVQFESLERVAK